MGYTPLAIKTTLFLKDFIDRYYPNIFTAAAKLTGLSDKEELAKLTEDVLAVLWENRREFASEERPGVFLYRILLQEVITFLRQRGDEERIRILRDIVLIDPALYLSGPPPDLPDLPFTPPPKNG
jgi:DNA-directed RNA polymerase specialized sigma24 family protein